MYKDLIQNSLDYIEDNVKCDITAQELSDQAGFSLFHYYRLFQTAVGLPVMQYILRRRLLHGVYAISRWKQCYFLSSESTGSKHYLTDSDAAGGTDSGYHKQNYTGLRHHRSEKDYGCGEWQRIGQNPAPA